MESKSKKKYELELLTKFLKPAFTEITEIDKGGMANLYSGLQTSLNRQIAIKLLRPELALDDKISEKFLQEARIAANLKHLNIIEVIDFGKVENLPYFILEFAHGGSLAKKLEDLKSREDSLDLETICSYTIKILNALEYAYENGLQAHRDIKPQNILLRKTGEPILSDFGIAISKSDSIEIKKEKAGTKNYMAPELEKGEIADFKSDLYSLGIMFFELLTGSLPELDKKSGKLPSVKDFLSAKCKNAVNSNKLSIHDLNKIIEKSTSPSRNHRYSSPSEMIHAIKQFLKEEERSKHSLSLKKKINIYSVMAATFLIIIIGASMRYFYFKNCRNCCYSGNCQDGEGSFSFKSGDRFRGTFKAGQPAGKGTYYFSNGDKYEGEFNKGAINGKGVLYLNNGDNFSGDFVDKQPNGIGTYTFKSGNRFYGKFKNGIPSNKGTYYTKEDDRYEGTVNDNMLPHGEGILYYKNGDKYEGEFQNGNRHGKGTLVTGTNKTYKGIWMDDKFVGKK